MKIYSKDVGEFVIYYLEEQKDSPEEDHIAQYEKSTKILRNFWGTIVVSLSSSADVESVVKKMWSFHLSVIDELE